MTRGTLLYNRGQARVLQGRLVPAIADFTDSNAQYAAVTHPQQMPDVPDMREDDFRERADAYWQHKDYALAIADCSTIIAHHHIRPDDYGVRGKAEAAWDATRRRRRT